MKRAVITVSLLLGCLPRGALAFDWSLNTTQSETTELNSNQFLRNSQSPSLGSYSTLTANAKARTSTSIFDLDADSTYRKYWGPGVEGTPSESLNYGFKARYEAIEKTPSDREFVEASWRQQSTSFALLNQLGIALPINGFLDTLTVSGGVDRAISRQDSLSVFATTTRTTYEPSSSQSTPFTDTLARATWRHSFNAIAAGTLSSEGELLNYDNATSTSVQIYRNQVGIDTTMSPLLSFRGNIGVANLVTEGGVNPLAGAGTTATSSTQMDWIGDASLTYKWLKNTTLSLLASQTVGPSVVGSLVKQDTVSASLNHTINSRSSISLFSSVNRQITTTSVDFASASATYSYNLTKDVLAQVTYRYQHRFASNGTASSILDPITGLPTVSGFGPADSNSIMVVLSNSYTILPHSP